MKSILRAAPAAGLAALAVFLFLLLIRVARSAEPVPGPDAPPPEHALASVLANGCSGTIISKGQEWACGVSAAHCFKGNIGAKLSVRFLDGHQAEGILLSIDRQHDHARFAVPSKDVLGVAPVCVGRPDRARYEAIGYPASDSQRRPYYFLLSSPAAVSNFNGEQFQQPTSRWAFNVDGGGALPGVSGSGIFANGLLCGVLSNNNGHSVATKCYCSTPEQLAEFLKVSDRAGCDKWKMGDWSSPAVNFEDAPAPLAYVSNRLLPYWKCENGRCRLQAPAPQDPVPPPPDAGHDPVPPRQSPERIAARGKSEKLPARLKGNCNQGRAILELEERGAGQGPPGRDGRDGKDFTPPPEEPRGSYLPAAIAAVVAVGFGKFLGFKKGY